MFIFLTFLTLMYQMRAFSLQIICLILLARPAVCQFEEWEIKSTDAVNAKVRSIETTPSHLFEVIFTFEVLDESEEISKGTIISYRIDENNGARKVLQKMSQYAGGSLEVEAIGPLVIKLVEIPEVIRREHKWLVGWVATPDRRKSLERLEAKVDSFYREKENDEPGYAISKYDYFREILPREEDGFLSMRYSKVMAEIPYKSGEWHLGTYIKQNSTYENSRINFEAHPNSPRLFWEKGKTDTMYFRDLWGRMIQFKLD